MPLPLFIGHSTRVSDVWLKKPLLMDLDVSSAWSVLFVTNPSKYNNFKGINRNIFNKSFFLTWILSLKLNLQIGGVNLHYFCQWWMEVFLFIMIITIPDWQCYFQEVHVYFNVINKLRISHLWSSCMASCLEVVIYSCESIYIYNCISSLDGIWHKIKNVQRILIW